MIQFERCHPEHITLVSPQPGQEADAQFLLSPAAWMAVPNTVALSGFAGGRCLGCAGLIDIEPGLALVWALLAKDAGPYMLPITRKVLRVINAYPAKRIEAAVTEGFDAGHKWLTTMGFEITKDCVKGYHHTGADATVYARERT